jgi:hypothetical protein
MKRITLCFAGIGAAILIAGCAPGIVIQNNAPFPVRAIVQAGGMTEVFSPSPGESSYAEVREGRYTATVIPDAEWIEYARATRQYLNDQLAHSDNLTDPQLLDVIRRLKDMSVRMEQFQQAAASSAVGSASCFGAVSTEADGSVVVTSTDDGRILIDCK